MSVLIKGMEMPKNCKECMFADMDDVDFDYELYCTANKKYADLDMYDLPIGGGCPLIEVPPHGRLIDADEFKDYIRSGYEEMKHLFNENLKVATLVTESFCKDIDEAPTVIEAEE
ncbi:hypothetical protein [Clostridioides difficile]|uniref:hypothetical protein n=1 Tax=Clostridioides difficile TaxID=1496 RepID=UPI002359F906|nr:hypothetical protein [Clostridioides difficile]MDC9367129.1 hypothetical protein [Clostridioides difficile]